MDIEIFNDGLISNEVDYDIGTYVKEFNSISKNPIDSVFLQQMIQYVDSNRCVIPHRLLYTYNVFISSNDDVLISNVKQLLLQYSESIDYIVNNIGNKIEYLLHPKTFLICLINSKRSDKYVDYYVSLKEIINQYYKYQNNLKSNKIEKLLKNNSELSEELSSYLLTKFAIVIIFYVMIYQNVKYLNLLNYYKYK